MKINRPIYTLLLTILVLSGCKKADSWLDEKARLNDVRPTTLKDLQAILNSENVFNSAYSCVGLLGADSYYLSDVNFNAGKSFDRDAYVWKKDINDELVGADWAGDYKVIGSSNIVLDVLNSITRDNNNASVFDMVKGSALFFRAFSYYGLAQVYCKPFNQQTASIDLGLVLRDNSEVSPKPVRASVLRSYEQMVADLNAAINLLPVNVSYQTMPTKAAAYGLLAKVYLMMDDYSKAYENADAALKLSGALIDFNNAALVDLNKGIPFPDFGKNPEVLFWSGSGSVYPAIIPAFGYGFVDKSLYSSYDNDDLRKESFYYPMGGGEYAFRGTYYGTLQDATFSNIFTGIASNEIYLIRAECAARLNKVDVAISDLNTLLSKRYKTGKFIPYNTVDPEQALNLVLKERRKELPFTGQVAWEDLRRLNKDPRFARTLVRVVNGTTYTLPPNDARYTLPIPPSEIQLSGIQQNER
jgi:tetratricopeptide (TPR) repeat protein